MEISELVLHDLALSLPARAERYSNRMYDKDWVRCYLFWRCKEVLIKAYEMGRQHEAD